MMGRLVRREPLFYTVWLDELVPSDHLLRRVDRLLEINPLVADLEPHYASTGRPLIDPKLMLRMLLVGYLYGVRSERRLVEEIQLNLAFCRPGLLAWTLGGMDDPLAGDHGFVGLHSMRLS